ncbi:MAG TPA: hypothetical protein VLQ91_02595, partial [Draconibacterium sp.]|nr:hypothetical protein [Draconibacterium sp.]
TSFLLFRGGKLSPGCKLQTEEIGAAYMAEGLVTVAGSRMYTSMADTDEIIDDALLRFEKVFRNIEGVK